MQNDTVPLTAYCSYCDAGIKSLLLILIQKYEFVI